MPAGFDNSLLAAVHSEQPGLCSNATHHCCATSENEKQYAWGMMKHEAETIAPQGIAKDAGHHGVAVGHVCLHYRQGKSSPAFTSHGMKFVEYPVTLARPAHPSNVSARQR